MRKSLDYLVGLDVGTDQTRCVVALEEDSHLRFISHGQAKANGWTRETITNQDAVLQSVEECVQQAEKNGSMAIEAAVVGVGGSHVQSNVSHSYIHLPAGENEVQQAQVDTVVRAAGQGSLGGDRTLLQLIPLSFAVDQQSGLQSPVGMTGRRLDAHVQVVTAQAQAHNNLCAVVNRASLVVQETVFEPFAAGQAVLEEREREMGVVVIDMGAGSVDFAAYVDSQLRLAGALPVGGSHFVGDVSAVLRTPREEAAQLIQQYGCAIAEQTPQNIMIEVPGIVPELSEPKPRRLLNRILQARAEETFELVAAELHRARLGHRVIAGVVLTGGLAALAGLCDVAESIMNTPTRIGLPPRLEDMPEALDHPAWATTIGLVLYAQRLRLYQQRRRDRVTDWLKSLLDT